MISVVNVIAELFYYVIARQNYEFSDTLLPTIIEIPTTWLTRH